MSKLPYRRLGRRRRFGCLGLGVGPGPGRRRLSLRLGGLALGR